MIGVDPGDPRYARNADRFAHRAELHELIEAVFARRASAELRQTLDELGIPAGEIKSLDQVYASPQVRSQGLVLDVCHPTLGTISLPGPALRLDGAAEFEHRPPPLLGEHSGTLRAEFS